MHRFLKSLLLLLGGVAALLVACTDAALGVDSRQYPCFEKSDCGGDGKFSCVNHVCVRTTEPSDGAVVDDPGGNDGGGEQPSGWRTVGTLVDGGYCTSGGWCWVTPFPFGATTAGGLFAPGLGAVLSGDQVLLLRDGQVFEFDAGGPVSALSVVAPNQLWVKRPADFVRFVDGVGTVVPSVSLSTYGTRFVEASSDGGIWVMGNGGPLRFASGGWAPVVLPFGCQTPRFAPVSAVAGLLTCDETNGTSVHVVGAGARMVTTLPSSNGRDPSVEASSFDNAIVNWSDSSFATISSRVRADGTVEPLARVLQAETFVRDDLPVQYSGRALWRSGTAGWEQLGPLTRVQFDWFDLRGDSALLGGERQGVTIGGASGWREVANVSIPSSVYCRVAATDQRAVVSCGGGLYELTPVVKRIVASQDPYAVVFDPLSGTLYGAVGKVVYAFPSDGGAPVTEYTAPSGTNFSTMAYAEGHLWAAGSGGAAYVRTGSTWARVDAGVERWVTSGAAGESLWLQNANALWRVSADGTPPQALPIPDGGLMSGLCVWPDGGLLVSTPFLGVSHLDETGWQREVNGKFQALGCGAGGHATASVADAIATRDPATLKWTFDPMPITAAGIAYQPNGARWVTASEAQVLLHR